MTAAAGFVHVCRGGETPLSIAHYYGLDRLDVVLANAHRPWCIEDDGSMTFAVPLAPGDAIRLPSGLDGSAAPGCPCGVCEGPAGQLGAGPPQTHPTAGGGGGKPPPQQAPGAGGTTQPQQPSSGGGTSDGGAMVWSEIFPDSSGDFTLAPGQRYAVLASASLNFTLAQIVARAQSDGFQVTYSWEQGQPTRGQYAVDQWLANLAPDQTSNHRWVYGEGNFTGSAAWKLGQDAPWPLTIYHVAHVMEAIPAPPGAQAGGQVLPTGPGCPSATSPWPYALGGAVGGAALGAIIALAL